TSPNNLFDPDRSFSKPGSGRPGSHFFYGWFGAPPLDATCLILLGFGLPLLPLLMRGGTPARLNHPTRLRGLAFGLRTGHRADLSSGAASELPFWGRSVCC